MATTEIEKLERRYAENPQGLTFAPLAEVHRKSGDVSRALELLRAGLELHPNYIPASIVLGRCHWDLGDLPAAENAFSHVLRLDDENVIALKSLADINEKLQRFTEAQRWLNRLISIDRSNDEARQQLARLEAARQQPRPAAAPPQDIAAPPPAPAKAEAPVSAPPPKLELPAAPAPLNLTADLEESQIAPTQEAEPVAESKATVLEFIDTSQPPTPAARPSEVAKSDAATAPAEEPAPIEGLVSQEFVPPRDTYRSHPELTQGFVEPGANRDHPDLDRLEVETAGEVELQSSGASEFRVPNAAEDFMEAAVVATGPRPAEPPPPPAPPELRAAPPPRADLELPPPAPASPARPAYSVRDTKGQSVAAFFAAMLRARPAGAPGPAETSGGNPEAGAPPGQVEARSAAEVPSAAAAPAPAPPTVSFDDLFGPPAEPSPLPKGSTDPGKEDLDQFQSWLQNLKR